MEPQQSQSSSFTPPVQPIPPHEFRKKYPFFVYAVLVLFILSLGLFFANLQFHFFDTKEVASPETNGTMTDPQIKSDVQKTEDVTPSDTAISFSDRFAPYIVASAPGSDTTAITGKMAVFVNPSDAQTERLQSEAGDDFEATTDDLLYYFGAAWDFLKEKGIEVKSAETRYLSFVYNGKTFYVDTQADINDFGIIMFFDKNKLPDIAYAVDIEKEYEGYYQAK